MKSVKLLEDQYLSVVSGDQIDANFAELDRIISEPAKDRRFNDHNTRLLNHNGRITELEARIQALEGAGKQSQEYHWVVSQDYLAIIDKARLEERRRASKIVHQAFIKSPSPDWWTLNQTILDGAEPEPESGPTCAK